MATYICVNIVSGNVLLPDGTKSLSEPVLTNYQRGYSPEGNFRGTVLSGSIHEAIFENLK